MDFFGFFGQSVSGFYYSAGMLDTTFGKSRNLRSCACHAALALLALL